MIKILTLIAIGIIIGWYIPRPAIVDTVVNKVKDSINTIINKFRS
jgi:uncharacterized membrane protein